MQSNVVTPYNVDIKQEPLDTPKQFELNTKNKNLIINDILSQLVEIIQTKYDMSTFTLNFIFNNKEFVEICNKIAKDLYEDVFVKTFNTVESYVDILNTIKSNLYLSHIHNILTPVYNHSWNSEKCGYIKNVYDNTHNEYCNVHKYLHNSISDHEFIYKTEDVLEKEEEFYKKVLMHEVYKNKLLNLLMDIIEEIIYINFTVLKIKVNKMQFINKWLMENETVFKKVSADTSVVLDNKTDLRTSFYSIQLYIPKIYFDKYQNELLNNNIELC